MGEAGIVVVTYNSEAEIGACLDRARLTGAEIVVVDNASTDGTCEEVTRRGVRLIANPENRGFAAAVNQGMRALDTPFVLLLNPDAHLETGSRCAGRVLPRPGRGRRRRQTGGRRRPPASRICRAPPALAGRPDLRSLAPEPALAAQPGQLALPLLGF